MDGKEIVENKDTANSYSIAIFVKGIRNPIQKVLEG
jgi:hypothetical protein